MGFGEGATRPHLDGVGLGAGRRFGRAYQPLDRRRLRVQPSRSRLDHALEPPIGVPDQQQRLITPARPQRVGHRRDALRGGGAFIGVDVGHHHRGDELADALDEFERFRG